MKKNSADRATAPHTPSEPFAQAAPFLKAVGIAILAAGLVIFWKGASYPANEQQFGDFISGAIGAGAGLGILGALAGFFDSTAKSRVERTGLYFGAAAVAALSVAFFIYHYGMQQIGAWDDSTMLDYGWRLYQGQIPIKDFPCSFPVAFTLGVKLAFRLFGVYWRSTVLMNALFGLVSYYWSFLLLTKLFGRRWLVLFWALTLQASTTMMLSFWWYNSTTTVISFIYAVSAILWLRQPGSALCMASYGLALLLLATMKANSAGILIPLISACLFFSAPHRWKVVAVSAVAFGLFLLFLSINGMNLPDTIKGYLSVASRGTDLGHFLAFLNPTEKACILSTGALAVLPLIFIIGKYGKTLVARKPVIPLILVLNGCYGFIINSDQYMDATAIVLGCILLVGELETSLASEENLPVLVPSRWSRYLTWICVVFIASGLAQGASREHVKTAGYPLFFEYDGDRFVIEQGFFRGVHCGQIFNELLREENEVFSQAQGLKIWFGPRMQWGYPAFDRPSPRSQPPWWEPGSAFPKSEEGMYFDSFIKSRYDVLVLFKNDLTYYTPEQRQRIMELYDVDQSPQVLTILRLKK